MDVSDIHVNWHEWVDILVRKKNWVDKLVWVDKLARNIRAWSKHNKQKSRLTSLLRLILLITFNLQHVLVITSK